MLREALMTECRGANFLEHLKIKIWRFPIHGGTPSYHPFEMRIFHHEPSSYWMLLGIHPQYLPSGNLT